MKIRALACLLGLLFALPAMAQPTSTYVSVTPTGPYPQQIWYTCSPGTYTTLFMEITANAGNDFVQELVDKDSTFATATPISLGQSASGEGLPTSLTQAGAQNAFVWPLYGQCIELVINSGTGLFQANITLGYVQQSSWSSWYPNQNYANDFTAISSITTATGQTYLTTVGTRQRLCFYNTGSVTVWVNFGNQATAGAGSIPVAPQGSGGDDSLCYSLWGSVPNNYVSVITASGTGSGTLEAH
jgi:hypothetical protein